MDMLRVANVYSAVNGVSLAQSNFCLMCGMMI